MEQLKHATIREPVTALTDDNFTIKELQHAFTQLKKNKAPGPDDITNEELALLDDNNQARLLALINHCWNTGAIPQEWKHAIVVPIGP